MIIRLLCIGKTDEGWLQDGISKYEKRLKHYANFSLEIIPDVKQAKNLSNEQLKVKEGELLLKQLNTADQVILLDEHGEQMRSIEFARYLDKKMTAGVQRLVFIIGGPYGFSDAVYQRATGQLSLSKLTFSHQMIRLFFTEQLYRSFSILKGEPYHHE
ncbi:23S rRNA (pseudouridine1915-N3)-methyltransferase [bacterium A37T11]|nr:23S rRNA (pseudouridine1915-N3)-methyltransferase [bacterium A37T11]